MNEHDLIERIHLLEYHQKLLLQIVINPKLDFFKLVINKGLSEQETQKFFHLCEEMALRMEEQKAEGFVYFYPLFNEFSTSLPFKLHVSEVIQACLQQNIYESLMMEFKNYM